MDDATPKADGWYRMTGRGDWQDWSAVPGADAEAEIAAGGGADLIRLGFGVAEPVDPAGWPRALAEARRMAGWPPPATE